MSRKDTLYPHKVSRVPDDTKGATSRNRTRCLLITKQPLILMSFSGMVQGVGLHFTGLLADSYFLSIQVVQLFIRGTLPRSHILHGIAQRNQTPLLMVRSHSCYSLH